MPLKRQVLGDHDWEVKRMDHTKLAQTILRCLGLAAIVASVFYGLSVLVSTWEGGPPLAVLGALSQALPGSAGGLATFLLSGPLSRFVARGLEDAVAQPAHPADRPKPSGE